MARIVHGECANGEGGGGGGGGGGASLPETQAFSTLPPWPPRRRVPVNYNSIDLAVHYSDNVVQPWCRDPGHDCPVEAFAAGWDRTVRAHPRLLPPVPSHLPPTLASHLPGRLSRLSDIPSRAPPPLLTWLSRFPHCLPTMPLPFPWLSSFENFVVVMAMVLIPCYGITITCLQHMSVVGLDGWCPRYGFKKRIVAAISFVMLLLPPVHSYILHLLWRSTVLIVQSGYRYLNKKLVAVFSLLGLLLSGLFLGGMHLPSENSLAMTRGSEIKMLNSHKRFHDRILLSISHETQGNVGKDAVMINADLRLTAGNADGFGQDQKAMPHWTSNHNSNQSGEDYEVRREIQNRPCKPHLSAHEIIRTVVVCSIVVALALLVVGCIFVLLWRNCVKRVQQQGPLVQREPCRLIRSKAFQYDDLAAATNNFAQENKLGQGGFGPVYRGFLRDPDLHVAIKLLSAESSGQGQREFEAEVEVLTQVRHRNIVHLVGWCQSNEGVEGLLLVYELMSEGSLDKHLHNPVRVLSWQQRYKIILDLASALHYLHHCCEKCIVHGDIRPENVMLDASYNAKLGDFGTARLVEHGAEPRTTEIVAGTRGYIDPELVNNHLRCPDADIYSFGVSLLEIASGKRSASPVWVRDLYDRHKLLDAADGKMNGGFDPQQMERVLVTGLWCAHQDPSQRPSIEQALDVLRCVDATLPVLPASHDPQRVRILEEQAYGHLTAGEGASLDAVVAASTCYLTSKDSAYLLAEPLV